MNNLTGLLIPSICFSIIYYCIKAEIKVLSDLEKQDTFIIPKDEITYRKKMLNFINQFLLFVIIMVVIIIIRTAFNLL